MSWIYRVWARASGRPQAGGSPRRRDSATAQILSRSSGSGGEAFLEGAARSFDEQGALDQPAGDPGVLQFQHEAGQAGPIDGVGGGEIEGHAAVCLDAGGDGIEGFDGVGPVELGLVREGLGGMAGWARQEKQEMQIVGAGVIATLSQTIWPPTWTRPAQPAGNRRCPEAAGTWP